MKVTLMALVIILLMKQIRFVAYNMLILIKTNRLNNKLYVLFLIGITNLWLYS